jgi:predicted nucleotide-binding protein
MSKNPPEDKRERRPKRPFPKDSLKEALVIAKAIQEQNAGKPMKRIFVADAIGRRPESSDFKYLLSSSFQYGLTLGTEKAEYIELTAIGQSLTKPLTEDEKVRALQQAAQKPDLFKRVYEHYRDAKLPTGDFFKNVIEREFGVPREWVDDCIRILVDNGWFADIIKEVSGAPHIVFEAVPAPSAAPGEKISEEEVPPAERPPSAIPIVNQIFVGHGKNKVPLEQLKKILTEFKVPFKVAVDEPHKGRPISKKVADLMKSCTSAIFIFTVDEEYTNTEGTKTFRPSDNVVYELGAASALYENKIVIFKEDGVTFASDFSDLGYIPFEKDKIDAKAMDLLKELVGLGFLKITPA